MSEVEQLQELAEEAAYRVKDLLVLMVAAVEVRIEASWWTTLTHLVQCGKLPQLAEMLPANAQPFAGQPVVLH